MNKTLLVTRAILRLLRTILHVFWGTTLVLFVYPLVSRTVKLSLKRTWSRKALRILGVKLHINGQLTAHMRVSNHISWLDVIIFNSIIPSVFIAKQDVRGWPLFGWLSARTETHFMQRDSRRAASKASKRIAELLRNGIDVLAFPEGTTTKGGTVLPFFSALLQGAIDAKVPVQPVAIYYHDRNRHLSTVPAFCGETNLIESIWSVVSSDYLAVTVYLLPQVDSTVHDRRSLTKILHDNIATCLEQVTILPLENITKDANSH